MGSAPALYISNCTDIILAEGLPSGESLREQRRAKHPTGSSCFSRHSYIRGAEGCLLSTRVMWKYNNVQSITPKVLRNLLTNRITYRRLTGVRRTLIHRGNSAKFLFIYEKLWEALRHNWTLCKPLKAPYSKKELCATVD